MMDKSLKNDIKDNYSPKQSSGNSTSDMSHSSSDHDERGEKGCSLGNTINEDVPANESSHQSGGQETDFRISAGSCQSIQEVKFCGNCQQPKHNIDSLAPLVPLGLSSENVQQETAIGVTQIESTIITEKSDCQKDLEDCHDSSILKCSEPCCDTKFKEVGNNGCDVDVSSDVSKELVPCAMPKDVSDVQEACSFIDLIESVSVLDGREKFSETSEEGQPRCSDSCYCTSSTQMVSVRDDQTCTNSVSSKSNISDQKYGIPNDLTDCGTNFQVGHLHVNDKPFSSSNLQHVAEDVSCNHELFRTLAIGIVDNILDEAAKSVLHLKNVDAHEISLKQENSVYQVSDNSGHLVRKSLSVITSRASEKPVMDFDGSDLNCPTNPKSSSGEIPYDLSVKPENDNTLEPSYYVNRDFQNKFEGITDSLAPIICNGNIVSSEQSNFPNDLMPIPSLLSFDVSLNADSQVKSCEIECSEAKVNSSNDSLKTFENTCVEYSSDVEIMTVSLGEKTEVVKAAGDIDKSNLLSDDLSCVSNQDLEANVECSNDFSVGESLIVPNSPCLKHGSSSLNCEREIDTSCAATPVLAIADFKDTSKDLILSNQEESLKEQECLKDRTASLFLDQNINDTDTEWLNANLETVSEDVNVLCYFNADCTHAKNAIVCPEQLSVAKDQDIPKEKAGGDMFSFQENADQTESSLVQEDLITEEVHFFSDKDVSVSHLENEKSISEEPKTILEEETACSDLETPTSEGSECPSEKLGMIDEAETLLCHSIEKMMDTIEENECNSEKPDSIFGGEASITEENECTAEGKETIVKEENTLSDETSTTKEKKCSTEKKETIVVETSKITEEKGYISEKPETFVELDLGTFHSEENDCIAEKLETSVEELVASADNVSEEKGITAEKEEISVKGETAEVESAPHTEENNCTAEKLETAVEELGASADTVSEEKGITAEKEEISVKGETAEVDLGPHTEENDCVAEKLETAVEELVANADTVSAVSSQVDRGSCQEFTPCEESDQVNFKDDLSASQPLLDNTEGDSADLLSAMSETLQVKEDHSSTNTTASNSGEENAHTPLPTMPCQFIVPILICPPIKEETFFEITDDESEVSHATSDSESDSNVKMVKPICDGINTINYKPLLEEDSNDRSTLSLISELDEASVKDDNVDNEQWEDESASLILDTDVDRLENTVSSSEVVQRVKRQRIGLEKMAADLGEKSEPEDSISAEYAAKIEDIKEALKSSDSLERLRELARCSGGLVNDRIRKEAWPRLLGIDPSVANRPLPPINIEDLRAHKSYTQVVLDVNRSLRRFPTKISATERADLQNQLTEIILRVLTMREDLSYYQGYHDVAVTTLLVAGKDTAFHILERISVTFLSDCMQPTFARTSYLLNYIYPLLERINPSLAERMDRVEVGTMFCLPWFLTWYGYSLNLYEDIVRLFDYFLASPPLAPIYLAAVVVGRRAAEVLAADPDQATVHALLSRIPETLLFEDLLREASDLFRNYPPDDIEKEVKERCERLRKAEEEEEQQRRRILQNRRLIQRRHSMPTIAARQVPGWYYLDRFLGLPVIQRSRILQVSATVFVGVLAWHLRNEVYRYF